jgi:hypothetical protein
MTAIARAIHRPDRRMEAALIRAEVAAGRPPNIFDELSDIMPSLAYLAKPGCFAPAILESLLRCGIRFSATSYLDTVDVDLAALPQILPFLECKNTAFGLYFYLYDHFWKLHRQGRTDLISALTRVPAIRAEIAANPGKFLGACSQTEALFRVAFEADPSLMSDLIRMVRYHGPYFAT